MRAAAGEGGGARGGSREPAEGKNGRRIRFGVVIPTGYHTFDYPAGTTPTEQFSLMLRAAKEAESLGFDSCWVFDHFYTFPEIEARSVFESWTTLSAISQRTSRIRLGTLVSCAGYRNPAYLAKISSCLDVMSNGRLEFGIGAGWFQEEHEAFGYDYPVPAERIARLDESVRIVKKMWTEESPSFSGRFHRIGEALNFPKPLQKPHPPILIGGLGERRTLRVVAEHADKCNADYETADVIGRRFEALKTHCSRVGRDYREIEKTANRAVTIGEDVSEVGKRAEEVYSLVRGNKLFPRDYSLEAFLSPRITGTPEECIEQLARYKELGITYFILNFVDCAKLDPLRLFAKEVLRAVREA